MTKVRATSSIHYAINTTIPWPDSEYAVDFSGHRLILVPETAEIYPQIRLSLTESFTIINANAVVPRFLSALSWSTSMPASIVSRAWGTPFAPNITKPRGISRSHGVFDYLPDPSDPDARLALALFREGCSTSHPPFQMLSFFRVLNLIGPKKDQIRWIDTALPQLRGSRVVQRIQDINGSHASVGSYLYTQGRCAVAHASLGATNEIVVNPDNVEDEIRMALDSPVAKELAAYFIRTHFGIASYTEYHAAHEYELEGFVSRLAPALIDQLIGGQSIPSHELRMLPSELSIRVRGCQPFSLFENLSASYSSIGHGLIILSLRHECGFTVRAGLNFANRRLEIDPLNLLEPTDDGSASAALRMKEFVQWRGKMLCNGVAELWHHGSRLGRTQPFLPFNMRFDFDAHSENVRYWATEYDRRIATSTK